MTTGPIVTNADRAWALAQLPSWMDRGGDIDGYENEQDTDDDDGGWLDEPRKRGGLSAPSGPAFVAEQAEAFEKFFVGEYKTYADWSALWRKSWWPKANPAKRYPNMAPKSPANHPFFRAGTKEFEKALDLATPEERRIWLRVRVAQFKPDDPRVTQVLAVRSLTQKSRDIAGDR